MAPCPRDVSLLRQKRIPFCFFKPDEQSLAAFDHGPFYHRRVGDHQGNGFGLVNIGLVSIGQFLERGACLIQQLFPTNDCAPAFQISRNRARLFIIMEMIAKVAGIKIIARFLDGVAIGDAVEGQGQVWGPFITIKVIYNAPAGRRNPARACAMRDSCRALTVCA